ncbi:MAG: acetyltransferase [Herbinix sp.]|nr:acetyltransferase [Herbinix sp.]
MAYEIPVGVGEDFVIFEEIKDSNREDVTRFINDNWLSTVLIIRGKMIDMTIVDGIVVYDNNCIIGLISYELRDKECEILSLDSLLENKGVGSELVKRVIEIARSHECIKLKLITTNDNINAIKFYQKRGFDMIRIYHNALEISRQLKPSIPLIGNYGIPLLHEIEFELRL